MKIRTIRSASLLAGLLAGIVTGVTLLLLFGGGWKVAVIAFISFCASAAITGFVMDRFVVYKLKPIYQIVLSRNVETDDLEEHLAGRSDMLEDIEGEIVSWDELNRKEILRLKENEKYRKEYIGNVSHEMKTPIFNIQGYILTLLDGALEDHSINRTYLERAEKSIDRLINIVTDLDEISRLESGVLNLNMERFDLVAMARETVEATEMEAIRKDIKIVIGDSPGPQQQPIYVKASKHYISQVFINLIINSLKYGIEGGTTRITFVDLFDKVMVEVSDNGVGIATEDIPRVFERFYRTDKSRSREQGGTGLGLSIVKHIIEAHQEKITLRSELGRGSTFSFTLSKN